MKQFHYQLDRVATRLHQANILVCGLLFLVMAASSFLTVILRYAMSLGFLWLQDLTIYAFGLLAIFSIPAAFRLDKHVRVDIFRQNQTVTMQRKIDIFAGVLFIIPLFGLTLLYSYGEAWTSFLIKESSPQIGGLPYYFLIKTGIPVAAILVLLQTINMLVNPTPSKDKFG